MPEIQICRESVRYMFIIFAGLGCLLFAYAPQHGDFV
jgi:hypothetical protein